MACLMAFSLSAPTDKIGGRVPDGLLRSRDEMGGCCLSIASAHVPFSAPAEKFVANAERPGCVLAARWGGAESLGCPHASSCRHRPKKGAVDPESDGPCEVLAASVAIVAGSSVALRKASLGGKSRRHGRQLGHQEPGLLAIKGNGRKSNQPGPSPPPIWPRTAIAGVLYTFLSAYGRLAPSGLRRFILRSRSADEVSRFHTRSESREAPPHFCARPHGRRGARNKLNSRTGCTTARHSCEESSRIIRELQAVTVEVRLNCGTF